MLIHQPWLRLGRDIRVEFEQCLTEGRDVEKYRAIVDDFCRMDNDTLLANEDVVTQTAAKMASAPFRADWKYVEPSTLSEIFAEAPAEKPVLGEAAEDEELLRSSPARGSDALRAVCSASRSKAGAVRRFCPFSRRPETIRWNATSPRRNSPTNWLRNTV